MFFTSIPLLSLLVSGILGLLGSDRIPKLGVLCALITFSLCGFSPNDAFSVTWFKLDSLH
ncbi:MAG: hypothetical protein LBL32_01210 [Holosporales bacterium]|nr:hypothetical protein [Holosporales bacterium]